MFIHTEVVRLLGYQSSNVTVRFQWVESMIWKWKKIMPIGKYRVSGIGNAPLRCVHNYTFSFWGKTLQLMDGMCVLCVQMCTTARTLKVNSSKMIHKIRTHSFDLYPYLKLRMLPIVTHVAHSYACRLKLRTLPRAVSGPATTQSAELPNTPCCRNTTSFLPDLRPLRPYGIRCISNRYPSSVWTM